MLSQNEKLQLSSALQTPPKLLHGSKWKDCLYMHVLDLFTWSWMDQNTSEAIQHYFHLVEGFC